MRQYTFQGSDEQLEHHTKVKTGTAIHLQSDLVTWLKSQSWDESINGALWVTYVIDLEGILRLAHRRSEHIACAEGKSVLAAGEMSFELSGDAVEVVDVTNLSTGYCPDIACIERVRKTLNALELDSPDEFTEEYIFRKCPSCFQRNVVKDGWYYCNNCGHELPAEYNY